MSTLAQLRDRAELLLQDVDNNFFSTATIDEGFKQALDDYNSYLPYTVYTTVTLAADGSEVSLSALSAGSGLRGVMEAYWPWDSAKALDDQEENQILRHDLYWSAGSAVLRLQPAAMRKPLTGEKMRIGFERAHTISGLDSAALTTLPAEHEALVVSGAAGYTATMGGISHSESINLEDLSKWGSSRLSDYRTELSRLRAAAQRSGPGWVGPWRMDKWDRK